MRSGAAAVLLGSLVGVVAGFGWQSAQTRVAATPGDATARTTSVTAAAAPSASAEATAPLASGAATHDAVTATTATAGAAAAESATAAPEPPSAPAPNTTASAGPASAPVFPFAIPLAPVATKGELDRAEVRCYEVDPEECGRAADAYDAGTLVPRDAARAEKLRKVELTRLVRRCEERSPHACLVLAGRYESGQGVDENDKHAWALVAHARDLCRHGAKSECENGQPK